MSKADKSEAQEVADLSAEVESMMTDVDAPPMDAPLGLQAFWAAELYAGVVRDLHRARFLGKSYKIVGDNAQSKQNFTLAKDAKDKLDAIQSTAHTDGYGPRFDDLVLEWIEQEKVKQAAEEKAKGLSTAHRSPAPDTSDDVEETPLQKAKREMALARDRRRDAKAREKGNEADKAAATAQL